MSSRPPVFIVGSPRSGTTWLYHLLLSSGDFAIYRTESRVFDVIGPRFGGLRRRSDRALFLSKWLAGELFFRSGLDADDLRTKVLEGCRSAGDFQRILMESIAAEQGASRWAECTPTNAFYMDAIKTAFPDARFVHMVRDGRDVALSLAQQNWIRPYHWDRNRHHVPAAVYWEWTVRAGKAGGKAAGVDYLEVRFEDLVRDTAKALARIGEFIDHPMDYDRIQRCAIGSVARPNTSFGMGPGGPTFNPVERWRSSSAEILRALEALVGPTLQELGYELATDPTALALPALERCNRLLYRLGFSGRMWLKSQTPLGRWFVDTSILEGEWGGGGDGEDKTLRPGEHKEYIRSLVRGVLS